MTPRLALTLAGVAAVLSLLGLFTYRGHQLAALRAQVDGFEACELAVKGGPKARAAAVVCPPQIALADQVARQAQACNTALGGMFEFGIKTSCAEPVKRLYAQSQADAASLASANAQLATATQDRDTAVARAEARSLTQTERAHRAQAVVETAPRDGAGLRVYGADSLRQRWGQARP